MDTFVVGQSSIQGRNHPEIQVHQEIASCCCRNLSPRFQFFHLNSGTPPLHCLFGSIVESLAPLSISLRFRLIARLRACSVQLARVAWSVLVPVEHEIFALTKKIDVLAAIGPQRCQFSLWIGPLLNEVESYLTRRYGSQTKVSARLKCHPTPDSWL